MVGGITRRGRQIQAALAAQSANNLTRRRALWRRKWRSRRGYYGLNLPLTGRRRAHYSRLGTNPLRYTKYRFWLKRIARQQYNRARRMVYIRGVRRRGGHALANYAYSFL